MFDIWAREFVGIHGKRVMPSATQATAKGARVDTPILHFSPNPFRRNTRLEKHRPDDPLNTDPPTPGAPPAPRAHRFKCVFCDCVMTGDGESIWSMGARAKEYDTATARHAKAIEKKDEEISALQRELAAVKAERDALKPASGEASPRRVGSRIQ